MAGEKTQAATVRRMGQSMMCASPMLRGEVGQFDKRRSSESAATAEGAFLFLLSSLQNRWFLCASELAGPGRRSAAKYS